MNRSEILDDQKLISIINKDPIRNSSLFNWSTALSKINKVEVVNEADEDEESSYELSHDDSEEELFQCLPRSDGIKL